MWVYRCQWASLEMPIRILGVWYPRWQLQPSSRAGSTFYSLFQQANGIETINTQWFTWKSSSHESKTTTQYIGSLPSSSTISIINTSCWHINVPHQAPNLHPSKVLVRSLSLERNWMSQFQETRSFKLFRVSWKILK
jgi:hypothetical protein